MALFDFFNKKNSTDGLQKFKRTYNLTDFGLTANVTTGVTTWTKIASLTVPAQQQITFGSNDPTGGSTVAGAPVYMRLVDTSIADLSGKIRFALTNANETNTIVVMEESAERLKASSTGDRTTAVLMPEYPIKAKQDSKLIILAYTASAITIDYDATNTGASIPVTVYQ